MKVGDIVVCNCEADTWYKGKIGTLVGFDNFGKFSTCRGDPLVMYSDVTMRLARSSIEVISESR